MNRLQRIVQSLQQMSDFILFGPRFPFPGAQLALAPSHLQPSNNSNQKSFLESLKDGFLWGVPKKRRSLERRHVRKHGQSYMSQFKLKTNLIVCLHCGNYHESHSICGTCYQKVRDETAAIQKQMNIKDRLQPQQEVVVLYEDDVRTESSELEGKKLVEMPKSRPTWFHPGLMTKAIGRRE